MEPFEYESGDDWPTYVERLEQYLSANNVTEEKKKVAVMVTVMGAKAYSLLRNLVAPDKPADKNFSELVKTLKDHLHPKPLIIAERFKFHKRDQKEGETIAQYVAALRKLADTCEFEAFLEQALRDRLVCGLYAENIQRKLLTEAKLTLSRAYEIAQGMEAAQRQASEFHASRNPEVKYVQSPSANNKRPCGRCGRVGHPPDKCYFRNQRCRKCRGLGHIAKMCRPAKEEDTPEKSPRDAHFVEQEKSDSSKEPTDSELNLFVVKSLQGSEDKGIFVEVTVNSAPLRMELDTGADVTLVSENTWRAQLGSFPLKPTGVRLRTYTGEPLKVKGEAQVTVAYRNQVATLPLLVVEGSGPSLFGRNWLRKIQLDWSEVKKVTTELETLLSRYPGLFQDGLGTVKDCQVTLSVKPQAVPKFFKARAVPYALREVIEKDLERLQSLGVITKVNFSNWAAPIVTVPKPDGSVRICGDYKVTVNPVLDVDSYPLPTPEDLFATLAGGKKFSKLDLSQAYQQVCLDERSQEFVTINTHRGLYRYNRLPFGVASAPAVFQQLMEKVLQGLPGVVCYIDDVLVTGRNDEEYLRNLEEVLKRLDARGFRLKKSKCHFFKPSVEYLGYRVDAEGLHATEEKVEAILSAPTPTDERQLRSFLGLVKYYGRFVSDLATIAHPLNDLLKREHAWNWSDKCEQAFCKLKEKLASTSVLVHYDINLPLKLACDASAYGVGAVISHVMSDGSERPVAYASRTLTKSEQNYPQIEKEALSIIFGVKKFHKFLYGRKFTLVTDHKPLVTILGPRSHIPTLAAARLQRWALLLAAYQYEVEFKSTDQHGNADGLSRLPLPTSRLKIRFYRLPRSTYCRSIPYLSRATISRLLLLQIRYSLKFCGTPWKAGRRRCLLNFNRIVVDKTS